MHKLETKLIDHITYYTKLINNLSREFLKVSMKHNSFVLDMYYFNTGYCQNYYIFQPLYQLLTIHGTNYVNVIILKPSGIYTV